MITNNRIEELKQLATQDILGVKVLDADKFAKLIITESAELVAGYINERTYHYAGYTILNHFGLED
jgi:hypothetical protein